MIVNPFPLSRLINAGLTVADAKNVSGSLIMKKGTQDHDTPHKLFEVAPVSNTGSGGENADFDSIDNEARQALTFVQQRLQQEQIYGHIPLFILGAGVSYGVVPLLRDIGWWLQAQLKESKLPPIQEWVLNHARAIASDLATRREAAEFFSALQRPEEPFHNIWSKFSEGFLVAGLDFDPAKGEERFPGLCSSDVKPTYAHEGLADMLSHSRAHVVSLNFDGLTRVALKEAGHGGLALHSEEQVAKYFAAATEKFIPAVIKVRGDVFYAKCENASCPLSYTEYPLDRIMFEAKAKFEAKAYSPLLCPICSNTNLRLQFSFPGYRAKEEAAHPMLWTTRRFLASRLSAIIILGLSGRWDRYLLQFLFDLARERGLLIVDVKPESETSKFIDNFRAAYYPSIDRVTPNKGKGRAAYVRVPLKADEFIKYVRKSLVIT